MTMEQQQQEPLLASQIGTDPNWKLKPVWSYVIVHALLHCMGLYGFYLIITCTSRRTIVWGIIVGYMSNVGVAVGAHRLYTHRSFRAGGVVRLMLILLHTVAGQNSMFTWVRDHRQHHKFSDTDADPHNATRGFFFSHMGWLMVRKHPAVIAAGKKMDLTDLVADPLVMIQKRYFLPLYLLCGIAVPVAVPVYFWSESLATSFFTVYAFRYITTLHLTWMVNSVAHKMGMRPYNKDILPVETYPWIGFVMVGEQYHNYHHTFPWDYRASDLGMKLNFTGMFIDALAMLGLAYDLRTTSKELVNQRIVKLGDGSFNGSKILDPLSQ